MLEIWTCTKCTANNELPKQRCWNCESELTPQIDEAARRGSEVAVQAQKASEEAASKQQQRDTAMEHGSACMRDLLRPYVGHRIGINITKAWEPEPAELIGIQEEFFSVRCDNLNHHVPYRQILRVVEAVSGPVTTGTFGNQHYSIVITVFDLVIPKGAVGVGISFPL